MSVLQDIVEILSGRCRSELEHAAKRLRCVVMSLVLFFLAGILLLWTIGFLIAALFMGIFPHLGLPGAACIAAGACLLAGLIVLGISLWASR